MFIEQYRREKQNSIENQLTIKSVTSLKSKWKLDIKAFLKTTHNDGN